MTYRAKKSFVSILPYAVWMAMMLLLPATPECYAARTFVTLVVLLPCLVYLEHHHGVIHRLGGVFARIERPKRPFPYLC